MTIFASVRIVTDDVDRLTAFYEHVTGLTASRPGPVFAEVRTTTGTLAISSSQLTKQLYGAEVVRPADNHTTVAASGSAKMVRDTTATSRYGSWAHARAGCGRSGPGSAGARRPGRPSIALRRGRSAGR